MDTTTKYINEKGLTDKPYFYQNMAGSPNIKRSNSGGVVNSSIISIIKRINQLITFKVNATDLTYWDSAQVGHGIGKVLYPFVRWRLQGDTAWTMCPQPNYDDASSANPPRFWFEKVNNSSIEFGYYNNLEAAVAPGTPLKDKTIEVDIYFVDIPFNL